MRGCLVGHDIEALAGLRPGRLDLGRITDEGDRFGPSGLGRQPGPVESFVGRARQSVDIPDIEPASCAHLVDIDRDDDTVIHRHGQRLRAAHPAETGGEHDAPLERSTEMLSGELGERLIRPLEDPLRSDVDPRARGHLPVHRQAALLEIAEDVPGRPFADEVGIGDEDPRGPLMCPEDGNGLARLDEERLVVGQPAELADDRVEGRPAPSRPTRPAVDDEGVGILGDLRIEVVHEHPERCFLLPAAARERRAARRPDGPRPGCVDHRRSIRRVRTRPSRPACSGSR